MGTEDNNAEAAADAPTDGGGNDGSGTAEAAAAEAHIGGEDDVVGTNGNVPKEDEEVPLTFPQRLMEILSVDSYNDIIGWLPHGKGFIIKDKKRFADEVLPRYFKKSKFTSFTRKLNRWNFVRVTRGQETGAYYHQMFLKDNPKLCTQMTCINSKSSQRIEPMNPVALGLGAGGVHQQDNPDPETQQRLQEQRQAFFQQWQQQQAFMTMMAQQQQANANKEGGEEGKDEDGGGEEGKKSGDGAAAVAAAAAASSESKNGEGGDSTPNATAMAAFQQQQQYYAMFMAHQQQMAAAMSGMTPQQQAAFGFGTAAAEGADGDKKEPGDKGKTGDGTGAAKDEKADDKEKPAENGEAAAKTDEGELTTTGPSEAV